MGHALVIVVEDGQFGRGESESKRWEGFNHVACIIIASAMAGIGLITDSLSGGGRGCNGVGCWRSAQDLFVLGESFGRSFQIIELDFELDSPKFFFQNKCQMIAFWIPFLFLDLQIYFMMSMMTGELFERADLKACSLWFLCKKRPSKEKQHQNT